VLTSQGGGMAGGDCGKLYILDEVEIGGPEKKKESPEKKHSSKAEETHTDCSRGMSPEHNIARNKPI